MPPYGKLVRDRIPEIIKRNGEIPIFDRLPHHRMRAALCEKLVEECCELFGTSHRCEMVAELGDIVEVLRELMADRGMTFSPLPVPVCAEERGDRYDFREDLYGLALKVRRSVAAVDCLREFHEQLGKTACGLCISGADIERKRLEKRDRNGGFVHRIWLIKAIPCGMAA